MTKQNDESDETVQVTHRVPKEHRDRVQAVTERGVVSEAVRHVYRAIATGQTFDGYERAAAELAMIQTERERLTELRELYEERLDQIDERAEALAEVSSEQQRRRAHYEDALDQIEQDIFDGMSVFPDHAAIRQAAHLSGSTPEEVIDELRERNPHLPEDAFQPGDRAENEWTGVPIEGED